MKKGKAMKNVLITIISVSYNCKKDVKKTIESLKTQTHKNFEYLVIDGKSKDGTVEEIEKHRKCFKYMTIFSEPDKGIYDAMNKGVSKASGKYIFFLNFGDCFCNENVLNDMVQKMKLNADICYGDIEKKFGTEIAQIVEGVTKITELFKSVEEKQADNYNKMFGAMEKDIRIIILKLADRLHNINTLEHLKRDRQIAISKETMDLYAPLANRLGMYSLKWELEDLSFKYLYPEDFKEIVEGIDKKREERLEFIDNIMDEIRAELKKEKIEAEITGRAKHLYSIYRKMKRDGKNIDQIYDLFALRILVNSVKDCYAALRSCS